MATVRTQIEGESLTHKYLWECCCMQIETAKRRRKGGMYFHMTAMLMAYLTCEAYINFAGEHIAPKEWENEKGFFSKPPYKGLEGKLDCLVKKCGITLDKGRRPYQTFKELAHLRRYLAHGKPDRFNVIVQHSSNEAPSLYGYDELSLLVTPEKSIRAMKDVETLLEFLHSQFAAHVPQGSFKRKALGGILGYATGSRQSDT